jgi:hypothetical protein
MSSSIQLLTPVQDTVLVEGPVSFSWHFTPDSANAIQSVRAFEVAFWSKTTSFSRTFRVNPQGRTEVYELGFKECRRIFHRHGVYRWRVTVQLISGERLVSSIREFVVTIPISHEEFVPWLYPYAIQFQFVNRYGSPEYDSFLSGLSSTKPLDDFVSLGLVFKQNRLGLRTLELEEKLLILSHIGLGFNTSLRFRMLRNLYLTLNPLIDLEYHWFSTGLEDYTSSFYSVKLGGDLMVMPRGFLTIRGTWVPVYRVRYAWSDDELRTWQGKGWEAGVRFIFPSHAIDNFRLFGIEIDFRRLPLEFSYSRIRDHYSETLMRTGRFSISYLLR